jgi:SAM-dependent MidA family methyltransferase
MPPRETFHAFMSRVLYEPGHGYYMRPEHPASMQGDYITASQHPLFAAVMARWLQGHLKAFGRPALADVGAGNGRFLLNLIASLEASDPALLDRLELFAVDKVRRFDHPRIAFLQEAGALPELDGCIFSFELFDALPCHILTCVGGELRECCVEDGVFVPGPLSDERLAPWAAAHGLGLEEGQRIEACLEAAPLYGLLASKLRRGVLLTFDYGFKASVLRRPGLFPDGTLMSYSGHRFGRAVLENPGRQDITYAVDFTALQEEGERAGLQSEGLQTLSAFLSAAGRGLPSEIMGWNDPFPARDLLFGAIGQDLKLLHQQR